MTRDPFLRLALVALTTMYALGLVLVAEWLGVWIGLLVYSGGTLLAVAFTIVLEHDDERPVEDTRRRERQPADGTHGFERIG